MNLNSLNLKVIIGITYLALIFVGLYFLFSYVDLKDLTSYDFIRSNKDLILKYKNENFLFFSISFFIFAAIWTLCMGFVLPLLLLSGFVFGKWWGILIILSSTTLGATLFYAFAGYFFRNFINEKLSPKFSKLKILFNKNEIFYLTIFRFAGGGGMPFSVQNALPVLFDMSIKNFFIGTMIGSAPAMFVTVALGSGVEKVIDQNIELSLKTVMYSPDIYIPIIIFFAILIIAFVIKKIYFK